MNSFLEKVLSKAKDYADVAGKKTEQVVEFSKLKLAAAQTQAAIKQNYELLGTAVYESAKNGDDVSDRVAEIIGRIDQLRKVLDAQNDKLARMKKLKKCPSCSHYNVEEALFCIKCGAVLPEEADIDLTDFSEEETDEIIAEVTEEKPQ